MLLRKYGSPYPPSPVYGPPNPAPPPPPPPPQPMYGPPPIYGPPSSVQVFYGAPHALGTFWEKLKWKLDVFTIGKLLLKLVLFKKFVSWVALLCLLFVIPTLKNKFESATSGGGSGGGERSLRKIDDEEFIRIFNNIIKALDASSYEDKSATSKNHNSS
ncbi:formin-like protein 2 [Diorhabda carinulata]|uniref:formin-like protein 2 n=1 Tax=Diorhabda carinulata TaxID=1163345 RepID=UPI0025A2B5FC|nr:formin-like protein 2 [Diorhabda carinulata]